MISGLGLGLGLETSGLGLEALGLGLGLETLGLVNIPEKFLRFLREHARRAPSSKSGRRQCTNLLLVIPLTSMEWTLPYSFVVDL